MVVLTFHVGASTSLNTSKCSHASLLPGKAGSCKQPLRMEPASQGQKGHAETIKILTNPGSYTAIYLQAYAREWHSSGNLQ